MIHDASTRMSSLGADIRALRKARGLTLADLSDRLGRSVGWLSQVERDLSDPSIGDLRYLAAALDVPLSTLFGQPAAPAEEAGFVVRAGARRPIGSAASDPSAGSNGGANGKAGSKAGGAGLIEELLSPDLTDDFEMVHSTFAPHSRIGEPVSRPTQEVGYLLSGKLDLAIGPRSYVIHPGDSFRIRGEPFAWSNPYDEPAVAIWVIAPPIY